MELTPNEISAIIGYFRNGNSIQTISLITGYPPTQIEKIVKEYIKKGQQNTTAHKPKP